MDSLERSDGFKMEASLVRKWKESLRQSYICKPRSFEELSDSFKKYGKAVEPETVKTWIIGPTMAPQRQENLELLVRLLEVPDVNANRIYDAVVKLRNISRVLGRVLNHWIVKKELETLDSRMASIISSAEIDLEEIAGAVEARSVVAREKTLVPVHPGKVKRLFKY